MVASSTFGDWYFIVGGDQMRVYASKRQTYVPIDDAEYQAWRNANPGNVPASLANEAELISLLAAHNVPPHHSVRKQLMIARLNDAGKLDAWRGALDANALYLQEQWDAATLIRADNQTTNDLLTGIGADPAVILAEDDNKPIGPPQTF